MILHILLSCIMFSLALDDLCHVLKNDLDDIIRVIFTD